MADWLDVPTHVLRFWESRFSQIKPVKRAGGRRYYRPSDMRIIGGVKVLLHDQGMTIRGVQKLFREEGLKHISSFSPKLFGEDDDVIEGTATPLDPAALEEATRPAPAARATRDAALDPIPDDRAADDDGDDSDQETSRVLFRHTREADEAPAAPEPATPEQDEDAPELTVVSDAEHVEDTPEAPKIPPTPDVPDTDPSDDDNAHDVGTGLAAKIALRGIADPKGNREVLQNAAQRLKALLDRAS